MINKSTSFSEDDKDNIVKFLNIIAGKAQFTLDVKETIELYKMLSWAQTVLIKKIDANIVGAIVEHKEEPKPKKSGK